MYLLWRTCIDGIVLLVLKVIYTICQTLAIGSAGLTHKRDMLKPRALKPSGLLSKVHNILLTLS
jgi:hypothetical protein